MNWRHRIHHAIHLRRHAFTVKTLEENPDGEVIEWNGQPVSAGDMLVRDPRSKEPTTWVVTGVEYDGGRPVRVHLARVHDDDESWSAVDMDQD